MFTIYVYILDTLADWELGHVTSELKSGRFFKKDAQRIQVKTVGDSKEPIHTMGGLTVVPDCTIEDMIVEENSMLILPGADTWNDPVRSAILAKVNEFLSINAPVCAICGATVALAYCGILNNHPHTSNGAGFLEMVCPPYQGKDFYVDEPSVVDGNLITAGSTGGLLFAKQILEYLDVFAPNTLEFWYQYFSTGKAEHFFAMMQSLPANQTN